MGSETVLEPQTQETAIQELETTSKSSSRERIRLGVSDVEDISELIIRYRMTETEACSHLNINAKRWFEFKTRKKIAPEFSKAQERLRAARLKNAIDSIDEAGNERSYDYIDKRGEVKSITKPGDWRAKAWIAERILAPERLGQQQAAPTATVNVYNQLGISIDDIGSKVYAARQSKAIDVQASSKQLTDAKP